jgi:hypothetical protein
MTAEAVFEPRSFNVRSVVEKVAFREVFLRVLSFSPVKIFHHYPTLISIKAWKNSEKTKFFFSEIGVRWIEKCFHLYLSYDALNEDIVGDSCAVSAVRAHIRVATIYFPEIKKKCPKGTKICWPFWHPTQRVNVTARYSGKRFSRPFPAVAPSSHEAHSFTRRILIFRRRGQPLVYR